MFSNEAWVFVNVMPRLQEEVNVCGPCNCCDLSSVLCLGVSCRVVDLLTNLNGQIV